MKSPITNHKLPILLLLVITATVVSCRPKGILHSWELRSLLVDLHKTDAILQISGFSGPLNQEARNYYYAQVLEQHNVTQAQFDSTLVWYTAHPALFDKIYPKVLAQLQAEEQLYANFIPAKEDEPAIKPTPAPFTPAQLDSVLWVISHGLPSTWNPLVHDTEDQLLPEVFIFGGGVVDSLQTSVRLP